MSPSSACPSCGSAVTSGAAAPTVCPACRTPLSASGPGVPDRRTDLAATLPPEEPVRDDTGVRISTAPTPGLARLGRFLIRGKLGEGAFGEVFRAYDPQLDRDVALKVAKAGSLDSPERAQRFLREAKAAANLRHPNIVPLFETGTADGRYFIASAYVSGQPLDGEIDQAGGPLNFRRAAELVRQLAGALGYAHKQGVVHRDVKPANILVDDTGEPHVLDFGLAARAGDEVLKTQDGKVLGTPAYMSPEQAAGKSATATAASDQYALGVMLYEMLTGQRPFDGPVELVVFQQVQVEPKRPRVVNPSVPRDLETVCLKCLEKEPGRRYSSCEALAEDLRRWLSDEPVTARRASLPERLAKWCRRNPGYAALWAGLVAVLATGTVVSSVFAFRAEHARQAEAERADGESKAKLAAQDATALAVTRLGHAEAATQALSGIFDEVNPLLGDTDERLETRLRGPLRKAADRLDGIGDPLTAARVQFALAKALAAIGDREQAAELAGKAAATFEAQLGPTHTETIHAQNAQALNEELTGPEAIARHRRLAEQATAAPALGPNHPSTLVRRLNLGAALVADGNPREARDVLQDTWDRVQKLPPGEQASLSEFEKNFILNALAAAYRVTGEPGRAIELFTQAIESQTRATDENDPSTLMLRHNLAVAYQHIGRHDRALGIYRDVLEQREMRLPRDHRHTLNTAAGLASAQLYCGQIPEAIKTLESVLPRLQAAAGRDHSSTLAAMNSLALAYEKSGQLDRAIPVYEEIVALSKHRAEDAPTTFTAYYNLGGAYYASGRLKEAISACEKAYFGRKDVLTPDDPATIKAGQSLAGMYEQDNRLAKAVEVREALLAAYRKRGSAAQQETLATLTRIGLLNNRLGNYAVAEQRLQECFQAFVDAKAEGQWGVSRVKSQLGVALLGQGKTDEAGPLLQTGYEELAAHRDIPAPMRDEVIRGALEPLIRWAEMTDRKDDARRWRMALEALTPPLAPPPRAKTP